MFHVPHGLANALLINQVIKYNATDKPTKQAAFPQYKFPCAKQKYGQIADELGLGGKTDEEKVDLLIEALTQMKKDLGLPLSIKEYGIEESEFLAKLDEMVELAFDDQCTGANPRYPLFAEMKQLYLDAYYGNV
jgi:acetaldehyde dehydrogenase/alcohol dehydrogenase